MVENKAYETPSTGKSLIFALGFLLVYAVILFIVLEVFFEFPF